MDLAELQKEAHAIAKDRGWWDEPRTFGDLIALVHSELSEALEAYREWGLKSVISATAPNDRTYRYFDIDLSRAKVPDDWTTKPAGVASELADVVIRVADMAEHYGENLVIDWPVGIWHPLPEASFGEAINMLHDTLSDASNAFRADDPDWADNMGILISMTYEGAAHYGIDLDAAIEVKMEYNRTREYRHGGKAL